MVFVPTKIYLNHIFQVDTSEIVAQQEEIDCTLFGSELCLESEELAHFLDGDIQLTGFGLRSVPIQEWMYIVSYKLEFYSTVDQSADIRKTHRLIGWCQALGT